MRFISAGAVAALALFVGTAQAGRVHIDDSQTTGITVTDNCGGTCFGNVQYFDNEHITFDWYVSLPSIGTSTDMSALLSGGIVSDYAVFHTVLGLSTVGVSFYSDGGVWDVNADANALYDSLGSTDAERNSHVLLLDAETEGVSQKLADYLNFDLPGHPSIDQLYVTSGTPEPGTWVLIGTGLAGMVVARRRRRPA